MNWLDKDIKSGNPLLDNEEIVWNNIIRNASE